MGWLQPLTKIEHPQAARHWGLLYLKQSDIQVAKKPKSVSLRAK